MNKNDLIAAVADGADLTRAKAGDAVDAVLAAITEALKRKDEVRLAGFGTFVAAERKASTGRNEDDNAKAMTNNAAPDRLLSQTATPIIASEWPTMYFVAEITETSTPRASGLKKSGAAQVLSMTVRRPRDLAMATIAGTS